MSELKNDEKIRSFIPLYRCPKCYEIFSRNNGYFKSSIVRGYPNEDSDIGKCPECGYMGLL